MGKQLSNNEPIYLNGAVHTLCTILKLVASSAAEEALAALFLTTRQPIILQRILHEMGHPQPATPIHCDNSTATSIVHETIKQQRVRAMNMRYFWTIDQQREKYIDTRWHPGKENLGDYNFKHHPTSHHIKSRLL